MIKHIAVSSLSVILTVCLTACGSTPERSRQDAYPNNFYGQPHDSGVNVVHASAPSPTFSTDISCSDRKNFAAPLNYRVDKPLALNNSILPAQWLTTDSKAQVIPLSPGDIINVAIEDGEGFNGQYVLDLHGYVSLPLIAPIMAAGRATHAVAKDIELALIKANIFQPATATTVVNVVHLSGIDVHVTGAVFQPGRVEINARNRHNTLDKQFEASGDFATKRLLSEALRAASGIRPDAKLDQVILIRNGWQVEVDMTGVLTGRSVIDYPLISGDRVIVPSTGCFQPYLVRPSQITPKGFRVFMSNLIDSAKSNAAAAVGRYSTNIPYGTRLLQAAISANCVGGKEWTNAPRSVLLVSKHPITEETQVVQRSVEDLMRSSDREDINPYLMPNDAIACYDSTVTNVKDVAKTIADIFLPFAIL